MLDNMAEAVQLVEAGTEGAVECRAPGCPNWFVKRSGRHVYCKAPNCTYRRGAPPAAELVSPEGAAEEMLRRLQESEEAEPGPALVVERVRALHAALQAKDADAVFGACVDGAVVLIAMGDRARRGELPADGRLPPRPQAHSTTQRPVGLVMAVVSSHKRTFALGDQRVELIYSLHAAQRHLESTELALAQTQGSPAEEDAREANRGAHTQLDAIERALQSIEAAWRERREVLGELDHAATVSNGNGHERLPA